ncbi:UDP-N-acetylglucosamine transferase subunit ALG13 [Butyrivibrio sp. Su6]|uniref:glycosyltransferase n=1 Tax=Butyrivibrio sp. Su6 TaxID=1520810 RepID=UPI00089E611D|nr:glycosyltransferase [Butyrivibrio sp. Su6]SEG19620.1 UDP-N-acetylglucosamine transferase subunit ALG13 [Butyrivibrio sp. Su6]
MIFVTVGTHEQSFNRLIEYMDDWAAHNGEEVIIQTGFSTYEPKSAKWQKMFTFQQMNINVENARIVITHGGPSSFLLPLQKGKIPIVVPRRKEFYEHVNDHQLTFCRMISERMKNIILVENEKELGQTIELYDRIISNMRLEEKSNNEMFIEEFEKNIEELVNR